MPRWFQTYQANYTDAKPAIPVIETSSDKVVCSNSSGTVSVATTGSNEYLWYAVGNVLVNNQATSAQNPIVATSTVSVKAPVLTTYQGYNINLYVTTRAASHCQSSYARAYPIDIGVPTHDKFEIITYGFSYPPGNLFYACPEAKVDLYVRAEYAYAPLQDQWTITGSHGYVGPTTGSILTFYASGLPGQWAYPTYKARNICGWSANENATLITLDCEGGEEPEFTYPNPASEELSVSIEQSEAGETAQVVLTNSTGDVVYQQNTTAARVAIPVRGLKPGMYQLFVKTGKGTRQERIVIEK